MKIEIDENSGFCFGVTTAISKAEEELRKGGTLFSLGDIVHNGKECDRLRMLGLQATSHELLNTLSHSKVLLRAHGEPPATYATARANNVEIIDATCPVVLQLQRRIRNEYQNNPDAQIVIFGKPGHAEVLGLVGQTEGKAIVLSSPDEADDLDFHRHIRLFSQTTQPLKEFQKIVAYIRSHIQSPATFAYYDTICRQVSNRIPRMIAFAKRHDAIIFVCGNKSSNGQVLLNACLAVNPRSYCVEGPEDITTKMTEGITTLGICGATSTPKWLMEQCKEAVEKLNNP
ncbi:MAG: 4-hydroxy-3-methylbut-2-enyl diphosphate reductase [Bacteroidaceae bacterium]|nr:4-hydroxy-3-methylbut-2-enyl diphosphate reductase [Bacteroidaceae bacterium]MBR4782357.1 4-hydroxy-3-methylbut-2-enyl diphosphate reductase [Bacteroidaceae bacterium]